MVGNIEQAGGPKQLDTAEFYANKLNELTADTKWNKDFVEQYMKEDPEGGQRLMHAITSGDSKRVKTAVGDLMGAADAYGGTAYEVDEKAVAKREYEAREKEWEEKILKGLKNNERLFAETATGKIGAWLGKPIHFEDAFITQLELEADPAFETLVNLDENTDRAKLMDDLNAAHDAWVESGKKSGTTTVEPAEEAVPEKEVEIPESFEALLTKYGQVTLDAYYKKNDWSEATVRGALASNDKNRIGKLIEGLDSMHAYMTEKIEITAIGERAYKAYSIGPNKVLIDLPSFAEAHFTRDEDGVFRYQKDSNRPELDLLNSVSSDSSRVLSLNAGNALIELRDKPAEAEETPTPTPAPKPEAKPVEAPAAPIMAQAPVAAPAAPIAMPVVPPVSPAQLDKAVKEAPQVADLGTEYVSGPGKAKEFAPGDITRKTTKAFASKLKEVWEATYGSTKGFKKMFRKFKRAYPAAEDFALHTLEMKNGDLTLIVAAKLKAEQPVHYFQYSVPAFDGEKKGYEGLFGEMGRIGGMITSDQLPRKNVVVPARSQNVAKVNTEESEQNNS